MNINVHSRLTNAYYRLKRFEEVQSISEEILARNLAEDSEMFIQAHRDLAVALKRDGKFAEAQEHYEIALKCNPDNENTLKVYIDFLQDKKDFGQIIEHTKRLLTLDPLDVNYYMYMGKAKLDLKKYDDAIIWFGKAEALLPLGSGERDSISHEKKKAQQLKELMKDFAAG